MINMLTQKNLLLTLALLAAMKFLVLPLISWQQDHISEIKGKYRQLTKVSSILDKKSVYRDITSSLAARVASSRGYFFKDSDLVKLEVQRHIEKIFESNGLAIKGLSWISDSPGEVRQLRLRVSFSGAQEHMIETFWALAASKKLIRKVEFRQQFKGISAGELGATAGHVTLEIYAATDDFWPPTATAVLGDPNDVKGPIL